MGSILRFTLYMFSLDVCLVRIMFCDYIFELGYSVFIHACLSLFKCSFFAFLSFSLTFRMSRYYISPNLTSLAKTLRLMWTRQHFYSKSHTFILYLPFLTKAYYLFLIYWPLSLSFHLAQSKRSFSKYKRMCRVYSGHISFIFTGYPLWFLFISPPRV